MPRIGGQVIPHKTVLLIASEGVLILFALFIAAVLRLTPTSSPWPYLASMGTIYRFAVVVLVCEISFYYNDLYDLTMVRSRLSLSVHLLQALGVSSVILGIAYFANAQLSPGRGIAIVAAPTILLLVLGWRSLLDLAGIRLGKRERLLIVGTGPVGRAVADELRERPEFHCDVVGYLGENGVERPQELAEADILGYMTSLSEVVAQQKVDRIILSLQERRGRTPVNELLHLKFAGVSVDDPHTFLESITGRILLDYLSPSWFILSNGFRKARVVLAIKRLTDLVLSSILFVLTLPIILLTAAAIALEDGVPVLFKQPRIGLHGKRFFILKFRSMRLAPPDEKPSWTGDGDSRITRVGAFIRKYRIDELPQLINVIRGDMSLVGPRPEQPYFCEVLEREIPYYAQRHSVRPGITGWAQIKFHYGASVEDSQRKLELDLFYIKHLSSFLDLAIILETVKVVLFGRGSK